ncbi:SnoaL-like domain-containing protein [Jatrophihabitans endophyticus]|uniref:SnoaL-like domain-containing protein n=1 Tax=Jatrophihabitans endophyticus TaxID=1206085 RepID=A0A1M5K5T0_9ACTN|nr:nuclear transport factor 2 family protein [Jatrophihabitans endophyticus]SHG47930.1 SnoaL-like domain-containing protein [Jatrophihabitans endophyticus]
MTTTANDTTDSTAHDLRAAYLDTWNATEPAGRRALLARHWAPDASYVDPLATATGTDELDATIAAVQAQFPGFVFTALGEADGHQRLVRFRWALGPAGADAVVEGFDVLVTDGAGRIRQVLGFLDRVPG